MSTSHRVNHPEHPFPKHLEVPMREPTSRQPDQLDDDATSTNGNPKLSAFLTGAALTMAGLFMLAVVALVAYAEWLPAAYQEQHQRLQVPLTAAVMVFFAAAGGCWVASINTRPTPTRQQVIDQIDEQIGYLEQHRSELLAARHAGQVEPAVNGVAAVELDELVAFVDQRAKQRTGRRPSPGPRPGRRALAVVGGGEDVDR